MIVYFDDDNNVVLVTDDKRKITYTRYEIQKEEQETQENDKTE